MVYVYISEKSLNVQGCDNVEWTEGARFVVVVIAVAVVVAFVAVGALVVAVFTCSIKRDWY